MTVKRDPRVYFIGFKLNLKGMYDVNILSLSFR